MEKKKMLNDKEKEVHKSVLKNLMKDMEGMMNDDMQSKKMQKVTVMAKDKEGLKEGLSKAEDLMNEAKEEESEDDEASCSDCGMPSCECDSSDPMDVEALKARIKELENKLSAKE